MNFKKLLFIKELTLESDLNYKVLSDKLNQITEPEKLIRFFWEDTRNQKEFEGVVKFERFKINPILRGVLKNSEPVIMGIIYAKSNGTAITMLIRPTIRVLIVFYTFGLASILSLAIHFYSLVVDFNIANIFKDGVFAFLTVLCSSFFVFRMFLYERDKVIIRLKNIFEIK